MLSEYEEAAQFSIRIIESVMFEESCAVGKPSICYPEHWPLSAQRVVDEPALALPLSFFLLPSAVKVAPHDLAPHNFSKPNRPFGGCFNLSFGIRCTVMPRVALILLASQEDKEKGV